MNMKYPFGWYVYSLLIAMSSSFILLGLHRNFYLLLYYFSLPEFIISGFTGIINLSWYEIGYVVGSGLKNVYVFSIIPLLGGTTGLISALLLLTHFRWRRVVLLGHLGFSIGLALIAIGVLSWRFWRGMGDSWRLVSTLGFFLMYCLWLFYFHRTRKSFCSSKPKNN
jgi:hypothetical protein